MTNCPQCRKPLRELARRCPSCQADLDLLVDYVSHLQGGLERAERPTRVEHLRLEPELVSDAVGDAREHDEQGQGDEREHDAMAAAERHGRSLRWRLVGSRASRRQRTRPSAEPKASYCLRFSGSESTSYAPWISLNRSSACFGSSLFMSGWFFIASFL